MDVSAAFISKSRELLNGSYLSRIELAVEGLPDDRIWWRANAESNSIGNLLLHLAGNVRQWIVSGIGGTADVRERDKEFSERGPLPRAELLSRLRTAVEEADRTLATASPAMLMEQRRIQGRDVLVVDAIYGCVEHFSMHTGQILLLAKMWKGDLGFYDFSSGTWRQTWDDRKGPPRGRSM
jgi:hypothetical protein